MEKCDKCGRKKPPVLTEQKIKPLLSGDLDFLVENSIPLTRYIQKVDKNRSIKVIKEARKLYSRGVLQLNEEDTSIITSNLGDKGDYHGEKVNLDFPTKDGENPIDTVTFDVPLFIRMLEYAKEDAKTDMDLHNVTEKIIALSKEGEILTMDNYDEIVGKIKESIIMYHRNPSSKQVNKFRFNIYESYLDRNRLRGLIKEVLSKSVNESINHTTVEVDMEDDEGEEFTIKGTLSFFTHSNDYDVEKYELVDGSYNEMYEDEINKWVDNNQDKIETALIEKQLEYDEQAEGEKSEYEY